jgi:hypothetical protein
MMYYWAAVQRTDILQRRQWDTKRLHPDFILDKSVGRHSIRSIVHSTFTLGSGE